MRGEQDLIRTLRTAADQVEQVDLAQGVAARRHARRIRQRVRMALAAVAAVAVAGGTTAALSVASGSERRAEERWTQVEERWTKVDEPWPQVEKRRPQALAKVPARTAGGARILPVTALSPAEVLLLVAAPAKGKPSRLDVYDMTRRTTRTLAQVPAVKGKDGPDSVTAGPGHIAWYVTTGGTTTFWAVPRTGGTATRVVTTTGNVAAFGVTDDSLVWSPSNGGVLRVPLTGGTPARVPGGDGLTLTSWPWAAHRSGSGSPLANQDRAVDLETGRSFDVRAPEGTRFLRCGPRWCAGAHNGGLAVKRVDGTGATMLLLGLRLYAPRAPYADRYVLTVPETPPQTGGGPLAVLFDLETGTTIGLGEQRPGTLGTPIAVSKSASATVLHWDADAQPPATCAEKTCAPTTLGGKEWTVLNLLALTR
ncbi:hypothetical protein ACBR40_13235 [Nonomuraea sp. AD125B]|uniref:hypothetical protein n=1 Tax=Nonomuraea sp. AD125B TaxID=3242897 RepID=UPI003526C5A3